MCTANVRLHRGTHQQEDWPHDAAGAITVLGPWDRRSSSDACFIVCFAGFIVCVCRLFYNAEVPLLSKELYTNVVVLWPCSICTCSSRFRFEPVAHNVQNYMRWVTRGIHVLLHVGWYRIMPLQCQWLVRACFMFSHARLYIGPVWSSHKEWCRSPKRADVGQAAEATGHRQGEGGEPVAGSGPGRAECCSCDSYVA